MSVQSLQHNARQWLNVARALISGNSDRALARIAQRHIARARALWDLARLMASRHTYKRDGTAWRAVIVDAGNVVAWVSVRTYGKRQSAQRAALRELNAMRA